MLSSRAVNTYVTKLWSVTKNKLVLSLLKNCQVCRLVKSCTNVMYLIQQRICSSSPLSAWDCGLIWDGDQPPIKTSFELISSTSLYIPQSPGDAVEELGTFPPCRDAYLALLTDAGALLPRGAIFIYLPLLSFFTKVA